MVNQRYRLDRSLARGGMGEVWLARDQVLDRTVALKMLHADTTSPMELRRFLREAQAAAQLSHPNVVAVYDTGEWDGRPYLVMELLQGRTFAEELAERGPLPVREVRDLGAQTAAGLAAAHAAGVVHRDIKPSNLVRLSDGTVKVVDFGVADLAGEMATKLTQTGTVVGTVAYLAPERLEAGVSEARSDLYGLGCVLYELLCGRPPFTGGMPAMLYAHVHTPPTPPSQLRPDVPADLDALLLELLAKDPADRPADAETVRARLLDERTRQIPVPPVAAAPMAATPMGAAPAGAAPGSGPAETMRLDGMPADGQAPPLRQAPPWQQATAGLRTALAKRRARAGRTRTGIIAAAAAAIALAAIGLLWYAGQDRSNLAGGNPADQPVETSPPESKRDTTPPDARQEQVRRDPPPVGSRDWLVGLRDRLQGMDPGVEIDAEVREKMQEITDEALEAHADGEPEKVQRKMLDLGHEFIKAQEEGRVVPADMLDDLLALGGLADFDFNDGDNHGRGHGHGPGKDFDMKDLDLKEWDLKEWDLKDWNDD